MPRSIALLLLIVETVLGVLHVSPGPAAETPHVRLVAAGHDGRPVDVDGIVCDNLRETPAAERDHLDVVLPDAYGDAELSGEVSNSDGTQADKDSATNVGTVLGGKGRLTYYPPDEFNTRQEPRGTHDVDGPATRFVQLKIRVRKQDGAFEDLAVRPIVLARPPVVLIHGINRGPNCWAPFVREISRLRGARGQRLEIPFTALDHFAPADYAGVDFRDRVRYPGGLFFGCGPVEIGAALLARHIEELRQRVLAGEPLPAVPSARPADRAEPFLYKLHAPGEQTSNANLAAPLPANVVRKHGEKGGDKGDLQKPAPRNLTNTCFRPGTPGTTGFRLAIRRVDIVGWSYGGVIARWYLASSADSVVLKAPVYQGDYPLRAPDGRQIDLTPKVEYGHDVRKLITLGSVWRGMPLVNYLNEIRFSNPNDPDSLAHATIQLPRWMPRSLWNKIGADRSLVSITNAIDARIRVKSPAMEVLAIDSPWMRRLLYGSAEPEGPKQPPLVRAGKGRFDGADRFDRSSPRQAAPFRDDVAYGSVAGDNSAYLAFGPVAGIAPYGALAHLQKPVRFPYIALERRGGLVGYLSPVIGGSRDYNDGLVPLWSAIIPGDIPGASKIVHAAHDTYFTNRATQEVVVRWLNSAALPTGRLLKPQWDSPVVSFDGRKRWTFKPGEMAPDDRGSLYSEVDGVGRIAPAALRPERGIEFRSEGDGALRVKWTTPGGGSLHHITLYARRSRSTGRAHGPLEMLSVVNSDGEARYPSALLTGLLKDREYFITAEARIENYPDPPILLKSGLIRVP